MKIAISMRTSKTIINPSDPSPSLLQLSNLQSQLSHLQSIFSQSKFELLQHSQFLQQSSQHITHPVLKL